MGGPKLLFDHQMVMDSISSTIYVFGGRVVASSSRFELNLIITILKKNKLAMILFILDAVLTKLKKTIRIFQDFTNITFQPIHGLVFYLTHSMKSKFKMDF